jgi:threonine-phosphate decarboxylase
LSKPKELDTEKIINKINTEAIELLVICNPNNPTGHLYKIKDLEAILEGVKVPSFKLFIDESFIDFVSKAYQEAYDKAMKVLMNKHNIFLLRSMTKTFSVPGLRIGYGIGHHDLIQEMYKYKEPWSLNTFALVSMPYFLDQKDQIAAVNQWSMQENSYMAEALQNMKGLRLIKGEANYHLIEIENMPGHEFFDKMIEKGIYLRTCLDFEGLGEQYFRIALRQHEDNQWFLTQLSEVLNTGE